MEGRVLWKLRGGTAASLGKKVVAAARDPRASLWRVENVELALSDCYIKHLSSSP